MKTLAFIFFPKLHFAQFFAFIMATFPFNWRRALLPPIIFLIAFSSVPVYAFTMEKKTIRRHILGREGPEQLRGGGYFLIVMCLTNSSVRLWPTLLSEVLSYMQKTELGGRKWIYWGPTVCLYLGIVSLSLREVFSSPFAGEEMRPWGWTCGSHRGPASRCQSVWLQACAGVRPGLFRSG